MSTRDPVAALEDMRDAILTIESYTKGYSYEEYHNDKKTQDAVIRNFEIPGKQLLTYPMISGLPLPISPGAG